MTPHWYQTELICLVVAQRFVSNTEALINIGTTLFEKQVKRVLSGKHAWLAAAIMSREWEYWNKLIDQIQEWEENWNKLVSDHKLKELQWPNFNIEEVRAASDDRAQKLIKLMALQIPILESQPRPKGFPDYAGQFLHTSGEVVFDAILNNIEDLLDCVLEPYLVGCFGRFEKLCPTMTNIDWRVLQQMKIAVAVLLDLMDVCGYARLFADYHRNDTLWKLITVQWDNYLLHACERLELFTAAIRITDAAFEIPHRGVLRTSWSRKVISQLQDVPRIEEFDIDGMFSYTIVDHESALVRVFAGEHFHGSFDGIDIFIEFYLDKFKGENELDFGPRRQRLREALSREEQRKTQNEDEKDPE